MASPGTYLVVHDKPGTQKSWGHHGTPNWYIDLSLDHYGFMQCYMPTTGIVRITDTLQYIPKTFTFPKTTTEDYLQQAIGDIIATMKNPPKTLLFLLYGDATKNCYQSDFPHLAQKHIPTTLTNFTLATTAATDSEWKFSTSEYPQHNSTRSKGRTGFATSEGATTSAGTHTTSKTIAFHVT